MTTDHPDHRRTYFVIFGLLMLLLVVTVGASFLHLGAWAPVVAMLIATVKGALIVLFFMHVLHEEPLLKLFSVAGFLWLGILLAFLISDYRTRHDVTPAREAIVHGH